MTWIYFFEYGPQKESYRSERWFLFYREKNGGYQRRDTPSDRQTEIQIERQTERHTERHTEGQTERRIERQIEI